MTGVEYPKITVGPHENLTVRMSLAAQLLMQRRGLDPNRIGQALLPVLFEAGKPTTAPNPDAVRNYITAFSCMVAENFVDRSRPAAFSLDSAPTADYWASLVDHEQFPVIENAVNEALKKAVEERRKRLAAVPPAAELAS